MLPRLAVANGAQRRERLIQITTAPKSRNLGEETCFQHRIIALLDAAMQRRAIIGFDRKLE